jgi:hypothetical protein
LTNKKQWCTITITVAVGTEETTQYLSVVQIIDSTRITTRCPKQTGAALCFAKIKKGIEKETG